MVKRGLTILLGAALASAFACGKGFEGSVGGSGPAPQSCTSATDCTIPGDPCTTVSCQNNSCLYVNRQDNVPLPDEHQIEGDCQTIVCLQGASTTKNIPNDPPAGNACSSFGCVNGTATPQYAEAGDPCGANDTLECDGMGNCGGCTATAECDPPSGCTSYDCVGGICEQTTLTNTDLPDETVGDCLRPRCNETGTKQDVPHDEDAPADQTPGDCLTPICIAGSPEVESLAPNSPCNVPAQGTCCADVCCAGTCESSMCQNQGGGGQGGAVGTGGGNNQGGAGGGV